jgi:hypothetical protein
MAMRSKTTSTRGRKPRASTTRARGRDADMRALRNVVRRAKADTARMRARRRDR